MFGTECGSTRQRNVGKCRSCLSAVGPTRIVRFVCGCTRQSTKLICGETLGVVVGQCGEIRKIGWKIPPFRVVYASMLGSLLMILVTCITMVLNHVTHSDMLHPNITIS